MDKWGAIEKSKILLSHYWRILDCAPKIVSYFWGNNNIFADCKCTNVKLIRQSLRGLNARHRDG